MGNRFTVPNVVEWISYTPTRSNITVGNGTEIACYYKSGKWVNVFYQLTLGSTSSIGTTAGISTPNTCKQSTFYAGNALLQDTGNVSYTGLALIITNTCYPQLMTASSTYTYAGNLGSGVPFSWGSSDILAMQFSYEEA